MDSIDTERAINVPLLRKTLEHIEAHPEEWDQGFYRCQSGMCFAGTAVDLLGAHWPYPANAAGASLAELNGDRTTAGIHAQRELGLSDEDAERLFEASNSLDDLRVHVAALCGDPVPTHLARDDDADGGAS